MLSLIASFDDSTLQAILALRSGAGINIFIVISELGRTYTILGFTVIAVLVYLLWKNIPHAAGLIASAGGAFAAVFIIKELVARARPDISIAAYIESSSAFPSGHAALSTAFYGFLAYSLIAGRSRKARIAGYAAFGTLIALISFGRIYLGVHYPSDVLGGFIVGGLFLALGIIIAKRLDRFFRSKSSVGAPSARSAHSQPV